MTISLTSLQHLREIFGSQLQEKVSLKRYTAARIGGTADVMITVDNEEQLAEVAQYCWKSGTPFIILGSGSNVLVSDEGVRQLVVLNRAKKVVFNHRLQAGLVWVESGANISNLARQAAAKGLSGLEWAAGIPGTVGGAVYGNAGAQGSDISQNLVMANILHLKRVNGDHLYEIMSEAWPVAQFEYAYRTSSIKQHPGEVVILSAELKLSQSTPEAVQAKMDEFASMRRSSQPSGASLGSIFKNPEGDYAGRLIEAAGLKGSKLGKVEISQKHANFFINQDSAKASDYAGLIKLVQQEVSEKFGVDLEVEIELLGDWKDR